MELRDELAIYYDIHKLVGSSPFPGPWSGGNQLLETWTGAALLFLAGELTPELKGQFFMATHECEVEPGIYDKNPPLGGNRREDDITHDDMLGVAMGSSIIGGPFQFEIVRRAEEQGWVMSNNGRNYFTAHVKPWHRAAYLIAAGARPDSWSLALLMASCVGNALFDKENAGAKRLTWIILEATSRKNPIMDLTYKFWRWRVRKTYGSLRRIFIMYHGERHPYALYCPLDFVYPT